MTQLSKAQITKAAIELTEAIKNWRMLENRGEFLVFRLPDAGTNASSSDAGEQMQFWRFDARHAADRFRNSRIVVELASLTDAAA